MSKKILTIVVILMWLSSANAVSARGAVKVTVVRTDVKPIAVIVKKSAATHSVELVY